MHVDVSRPRETDTDGLKVPVIYEDSPYYAGGADVANWAVDHELGAPPADAASARPTSTARNTSPTISTIYESTWLPRGFAVVHSESPGTGNSDGCPNSGAPIETLGATAVIDWLNGRAQGLHDPRRHRRGHRRHWHNGNSAMMGTSYNGTIPIAAATTGVEGLKAIVPISAISDWYDYYRANGMRAPHSRRGTASRARTSTCSPSTSTRATTRARTARSAGRRSTRSRPTRTARPATAARSGTSATT